ncbi:4570_t:CDS:2, partial [Paraglomus occultum]
GKIDLIYIDPPYNTGNKDFIYNDNYVDKEDQFKHSEDEAAQLRLLCNQIFGEQNF